ncbi:unnamed protein product [Effrenium voratum]|nr:unnamed protein product [Effrenium voratum]
MPAKRPVPLTDAALGHKSEATGELTNQSAIGETNAGVPLPVKNTFIDVPSGFSPTTTPTDAQPVSTAPAQVHFQQGFLKRAVLESVEESSAAPSNGPSQGASAKGPPSVRSNFGGSAFPATPLMTPSPTGTSFFSESRYQLFGGPSPLKEGISAAPGAGPPALAGDAYRPPGEAYRPGGAGAPGGLLLSVPPPGQANQGAYGFVREPISGALGSEVARLALGKADSDEEDADSEAERQQAQMAAAGRTVETAPKPPPGAVHPSLGSAFHESGNCKRCCFFPRNRCLNGYECEFCHYEHEKRKRKNKKNKKKKAGEHMDDYFADGGNMLRPDLGWPPAARPALHPGPHPPPFVEGPLTYQWTDGLPGQTPPPPVLPGYDEYVAACCRRSLGQEPPALATNPPPKQQQYLEADRAYGFDPGPFPPLGLDPAAAPWVPPLSPPYPPYGASGRSEMSYPPPDTSRLGTLGTSPDPNEKANQSGPEMEGLDSHKRPLKLDTTTGRAQEMPPNMPPPDSSPKLSTDLMATLQQSTPPQPDESPT